MNVLIACEESQTECLAFRSLGHNAYSCDIQDCSGGHPEWHLKGNCRDWLYNGWDLIIAHPPCTILSNAGNGALCPHGILNVERYNAGLLAKEFFLELLNAPCPHVCVENPSPNKIWGLPDCSQYIEPFMFGDPFKKKTLLWLRGLPILMATDIVVPVAYWVFDGRKASMPGVSNQSAKHRSKSFPGIAAAMASQWSNYICG